MRLSGLTIGCGKSGGTPLHERFYFGFDVDLAFGIFKAPIARWEHLQIDVLSILNSKGFWVQARKFASLVGTNISMKLARGSATQLDTRNLYHIPNNVAFLLLGHGFK